ncbi:MAG: acetyl-CoA carboxylase carboxyl transferase subunit beta, partial [Gammaproteobacteria bacterium]|nr:acetyl-CoA carboxylase carboxyl transferase subunit beta [Gammaproteobacteria bacterium]
MAWFKKTSEGIRMDAHSGEKKGVPEGVWQKCPACHAVLYKPELEGNQHVCHHCAHHFRINVRERIAQILDADVAQQEIGAEVLPIDALNFVDTKPYCDRLADAQAKTGETDALVTMDGYIHGIRTVICVFDFEFLGGSMGSVVGERFIRGIHHALAEKLPLICFTASGGA